MVSAVDHKMIVDQINAFYDGMRQGTELFAWWKDGVQYVGTTGKTLDEARKMIEFKRVERIELLQQQVDSRATV